MSLNIYIAFFLLFCNYTFSQISGKVSDISTDMPIPNVNIISNSKGTVTNAIGDFFIEIDEGEKIRFTHIGYEPITLLAAKDMLVKMSPTIIESDEIIVKAGLTEEILQNLSSSISIISDEKIRKSGADHFQYFLDNIPNLNWAGGTSRPRYFQIRGIGERGHYFGEGPPNFSIGYLVDDIDISGMGMIGQLHDIEQIEVFKGPQSSVYGANAIAGLISIKFKEPTKQLNFISSIDYGSDNHFGLRSAISNKITKSLSFRLSGNFNRSDGFTKNRSKNINNTNGKEESLFNLKLKFEPSNKIDLLSTILYSRLNNGNDKWAIDNNQDYKTYTDDFGEDSQTSIAYALRATFKLNDKLGLKSITSFSDIKLVHSYDSDWGDSLYFAFNYDWTPESMGDDWYPRRDFYKEQKDRSNITQELRIYSNTLLLGLYIKNLKEKQKANGYLYAGVADDGESDYNFKAVASYFQYNYKILSKLNLKANFRIEQNQYNYEGNAQKADSILIPVNYNIKDNMLGYRISLNYKSSMNTNYFISVARGYKAGGINQQPNLIESSRPYGPEYADNFEFGLKLKKNKHITNLTVFKTYRKEQQVSISSQVDKSEPNSFLFYTTNAGSGNTMGVEYEHSYQLSKSLSIFSNLGLLDSWVNKFTYQSSDSEGNIIEDYGGERDAAMAPKIMGSIGFDFSIFNISFYSNTTYKSEYYFSDSHNEKSDSYSLTNLTISRPIGKVNFKIWIRNIFDERYAVRGFYFGMIPPDWTDQLYLSYGDPRQFGITMDYIF